MKGRKVETDKIRHGNGEREKGPSSKQGSDLRERMTGRTEKSGWDQQREGNDLAPE